MSQPAVRVTNKGAVLKGFVIGRRAPIVSAIVSKKISIGHLQRIVPRVSWITDIGVVSAFDPKRP